MKTVAKIFFNVVLWVPGMVANGSEPSNKPNREVTCRFITDHSIAAKLNFIALDFEPQTAAYPSRSKTVWYPSNGKYRGFNAAWRIQDKSMIIEVNRLTSTTSIEEWDIGPKGEFTNSLRLELPIKTIKDARGVDTLLSLYRFDMKGEVQAPDFEPTPRHIATYSHVVNCSSLAVP